MGVFSFLRKDRQESPARDNDFYSRAEEESQNVRSKRKSSKRDQPVDPVLPEKKRARRRLVGAVALVLAAIIVLPMLLDSEPRPLSDDISIQIPSKETPTPLARVEEPAARVEEAPAVSHEEEKAPSVRPVEKPVVEKPVVQPPPAPASPPVAKVEPPKAPQPPAISKSDTSAEAARARAILEGNMAAASTSTASSSSAGGKVALQVAALASQDKANELQKKLQAAGLKSYTQKVATASGASIIRVRVGPFANEAEAEKARAKLGSLGLTGTITAH